VNHHSFHTCCGMMILANVAFIGFQTDQSVKNIMADPPQADPEWFKAVSMTFVGLFAAEVLLRVLALRIQFLIGHSWKWNVFDLVLVLYSVLDELLEGFSPTYWRVVRGARMIRVLRFIRVVRFFRELRLMVCSIGQSLVSLSWAILLLLVIMYVFSICFMHAATLYVQREAAAPEGLIQELSKWYGNLGRTMFTLLLAISGGEDWVRLVEPLGQISTIYTILFAFYVVFVITGVLNALTSVLVERAREQGRLDRDLKIQSEMAERDAEITSLKCIFEEVDVDGSGQVTWEKFKDYVKEPQVQAYLSLHQIDASDPQELFHLLDLDDRGNVEVEEWVLGLMRLKGQARSADIALLLKEERRASKTMKGILRKVEEHLNTISGMVQTMTNTDVPYPCTPASCSSKPYTPAGMVARPRHRL